MHARISVMSAYSCAQVQRTQAARAPKCRASEVSADVRDNSKDCTRDDLRESMTRLVLGMRRMTTLHDTSTASGALEAFVSLFSATANVCGGGGAPTHGRRGATLLGSPRTENSISVDPYIIAAEAVEILLK